MAEGANEVVVGIEVETGAFSILEKDNTKGDSKKTWYHFPRQAIHQPGSLQKRMERCKALILEKTDKLVKAGTPIPAIFVVPDHSDGEESHKMAIILYNVFVDRFTGVKCIRHTTAAIEAATRWRKQKFEMSGKPAKKNIMVVTVHAKQVCFSLATQEDNVVQDKAHCVLQRDEKLYVKKLEYFLQRDFLCKRPNIEEILWTGTDLAELARLKPIVTNCLKIPFYLPTPLLPSIMCTKGAAEVCLEIITPFTPLPIPIASADPSAADPLTLPLPLDYDLL